MYISLSALIIMVGLFCIIKYSSPSFVIKHVSIQRSEITTEDGELLSQQAIEDIINEPDNTPTMESLTSAVQKALFDIEGRDTT